MEGIFLFAARVPQGANDATRATNKQDCPIIINILSRSKIVCKLCIFSNVDRLLLLFTGTPKLYYGELDMVVVPPGSKDVINESKTGVMPNSN